MSRPPRPSPLPRSARSLAIALLLIAFPIATAGAQRRAVTLEIRPRAGDTLHMRLDQEVELTGTTRAGTADETKSIVTTMRLLARAIVQRVLSSGVVVQAVTDSVVVTSSDDHAPALLRQMRRSLVGRPVRMRVSPDGTCELLDAERAGAAGQQLSGLVSLMPGTLPRGPVAVGDRWTRTMPLPVAASPDAGSAGTVTATFRLDSLTEGGDLAWVSVHGTVTRDAVGAQRGGSRLTTSGTVAGIMQIDRRLGWMTGASAAVAVQSLLTPPAGSHHAPMRFHVRITQRMVLLKQ